MAYELYYTSAPKGIKPGSSGFCTVAATQGIPTILAERLEGLSGYQPLPAGNSGGRDYNPVSCSHWRVFIGSTMLSVLSRVAAHGLDYTHRPNKLAYHLALDAAEQPLAGPAWLLAQPGVMATAWSGAPQALKSPTPLPCGDRPPRPCSAWAAASGDAGWAGVLGEAFLLDPTRTSYLIYEPQTEPLALVEEAIALVPPRYRWQVTFSTYFMGLPAGLTCTWRCAVAGTAAAKEAGRCATSGVVVDLTRPRSAPDNPAARAARAGEPLFCRGERLRFRPRLGDSSHV